MTLTDKINYINKKIPFSQVLYKVKGIDVDSTTQIYCPYHDDINEKSARIYINNMDDYSSDGLFCFKCGNFNSFKIVYTALDADITASLDYFRDEFGVNFDEQNTISSQYNIELSEIVQECKAHSTKVKWSLRDIVRLQNYIKKFRTDSLTKIRWLQIKKKLEERPTYVKKN